MLHDPSFGSTFGSKTDREYGHIHYRHLRAEHSLCTSLSMFSNTQDRVLKPVPTASRSTSLLPSSVFSKLESPSTCLMENQYSRDYKCGTGLVYHSAPVWLHSGQMYSADVMLPALKDWDVGFPINSGSTQAELFLGFSPSLPADFWRVKCGFVLEWDISTCKFLEHGWKETWKHRENKFCWKLSQKKGGGRRK